MVSKKKDLHIDACLRGQVDGDIPNGLDGYRLPHKAFPEVDLDKVDISVEFLGKKLKAPIAIAPMTGGSELGKKINRTLAKAAQNLGLAMAVGSQRVAIEDPDMAHTFKLRDIAPDILLFANLGAIQLNNGFGVEECKKAVEMIGANALMLHLNPLQEALQEKGDCNFSGLTYRVKEVISQMNVPVILREVSFGISKEESLKMVATGASGLDVGGAGGTSWALVEGRINSSRLAYSFSGWGISTAESVINVRKADKNISLIATGGIRTGVDIAKVIAIGADVAGIARPLLPLAMKSVSATERYLRELIQGLRIAMFCAGCRNIMELQKIHLKQT